MATDPSNLSPEEELAQLRQQVATYEAKEKAQHKSRQTWLQRLSSLASWFFVGPTLKKSVTNLVEEYRDPDQPVSDGAVIDVGTNLLERFTRVGCFALVVAVIPIVLLGVQSTLLYYQNIKIDHQNVRLDQQTQLQEADRRSSLVFLLSNTLEAINTELKEDYGKDSIRNLSPQLIGQIIALSRSFRPYRFLENDTLIAQPLSPERGQLLVSLVESQLDAVTYENVFSKAIFDRSDLRGANLSGADLSLANLIGADLILANLRGAKVTSKKWI